MPEQYTVAPLAPKHVGDVMHSPQLRSVPPAQQVQDRIRPGLGQFAQHLPAWSGRNKQQHPAWTRLGWQWFAPAGLRSARTVAVAATKEMPARGTHRRKPRRLMRPSGTSDSSTPGSSTCRLEARVAVIPMTVTPLLLWSPNHDLRANRSRGPAAASTARLTRRRAGPLRT